MYPYVDAILASSISAMLSESFSWNYKHTMMMPHRDVRMWLMLETKI
jgi:hypothetical protein